MNEFSAEWLALRAPADTRARARRLHAMIRNYFEDRERIRIVDIGCGTGASVALFSEMPGPRQDWVLLDHDPALLSIAGSRELADHQSVETRQVDLARDIPAIFEARPDLVTAQAFFDLVSSRWMMQFVEALAASGAALYAPLIYDGEETWFPPHTLDEGVLAELHVDMESDKGFGPALGPQAVEVLGDMLGRRGYSVWQLPSPWELTAGEDADLIAALASGTANAVRPALGPLAATWGKARAEAEAARIGHVDILAIPAADAEED